LSEPVDPVAGWSARHHGIDPSGIPMVTGWLRLVRPAGRVLARRGVPADAVTLAGVGLAATGAWAAARRPLLALVLAIGSAWCDGVDGAVAVFSGRTSRHGAVLDKAADRVSDAALAATLWRCGAPAPLAICAAAAALGVEAVREAQGGRARATVTVGERPTRVICAAAGCLAASISPVRWPAGVSAGVLSVLSAIAVGQLRRVREPAPVPPGGPAR
jgi:CDP-diacylglycerol--glycerol-3-phosphate 3-phosphatidyltransferase